MTQGFPQGLRRGETGDNPSPMGQQCKIKGVHFWQEGRGVQEGHIFE